MTKQEVWRAAKDAGLDEFISKVAAAFPDSIEAVIIINDGVTYGYRREVDSGESRKVSGRPD